MEMLANLELHAAAIVAIPALIMLARNLAGILPGKRAVYANIAGQLLVASGIAIGMDVAELGAGEMATNVAMFAGVNIAASWAAIAGAKKVGGQKVNAVIKGKTGTGDGRQ